MKFSELWLRELVKVPLDSVAFSNQMTMAGLKVDNIEPVVSIFHGVVVGEIVECGYHMKADKLQLIKVNIGDERLLKIVCNAPNCRQGLKVAVATVDTALPNNFKIKALNLFGELSEGILCSYFELGISDDNSNIIELPTNALIGTDIRDYLKINDNIIEINVTSNRADCLSIIGIARDMAVMNKTKLHLPKITPVTATVSDIIPIQVKAANACPRYINRIIKDINMKALTPLWMKEKLRRCGIQSINAVIDVNNYVLIELGQPIHAFDKDRINGGIVVRMAKNGEKLSLSNSGEVKLSTDTLVIADYDKALAIGGILIGEYSSISNETRNLLLECAFFNPSYIFDQARHYGLHTHASHRYERGVDPALQYKAIERVTHLLINICGGKVGPVVDITNEEMLPKRASIILHRIKLDRLIGHHIDDIQVNDILCCLGCNVTKCQDSWQVLAPSWRFDIEIEEDLVEEIARIYGYNNIPDEPIQANLIMNNHYETDLSLKRVKMLLNDKGYQEVITYSFVNPKVQQLIHPDEEALTLPNPISNEMSVMRLSLWSGLLGTIIYNQNRQQNRVRIFETGLRFLPDTQANLNIRQDIMLAGAICGKRYEEHWDILKSEVDFYDMKGDVESILDLTGKLSEIEFRAEIIMAFHPGQSAAIYLKGERIGSIGVVHPEIERKLDLNGRIILFELEWNKIAKCLVPNNIRNVSRLPMNRRDIAIVVAENIPVADILAECKKIGANTIFNVNLFDLYYGDGVAKGFKSLAISLIFQCTDCITKEEINVTVNKCLEVLKEKFQASLRN